MERADQAGSSGRSFVRMTALHAWFQRWTAPYVIGHRGTAALRPENTMESFRYALANGADALEMDIHLTVDHQLVVAHDATVDRTTDGQGPIGAFSWEALRELDAGSRFSRDGGRTFPWRGCGCVIPALEEVFTYFPDTPLVLEIKASGLAVVDALVDLLSRKDRRAQVLVGSFSGESIYHFRKRAPDYATGATHAEIRRFVLAAFACIPSRRERPYQALIVPQRYRTIPVVCRRTVSAARAAHVPMQVWTVNDREEMRRLYGLGVQGITTDYPGLARACLSESATSH